MDQFVTTKTVVGEAVKVDDAIILPLVDVTCGMAAGSFADNAKQNGGGGMSAKMSPSAVLVIQNGVTKLVNIKQQDAVTKVLDMVPDFVNKFTGKQREDDFSGKSNGSGRGNGSGRRRSRETIRKKSPNNLRRLSRADYEYEENNEHLAEALVHTSWDSGIY